MRQSQPASPGLDRQRVGRYTILESLAQGGMAHVYIAQRDGAEEICVLKRLLTELEGHDAAKTRFHREAHVASYLRHPNIARVVDAGYEDSTFCMAMEYIVGMDMESAMHRLWEQERMLPYQVTLPVAIGVLNGLFYAHNAKDPTGQPLQLVHRDLSPRNIMLSIDGESKIIDFGLARGKIDDFHTAPGILLGTLRYVSPEQAVAEPVDFRSDLYSLSVVLHEMLTGHYLVKSGEPMDVLSSVLGDRFPLVTELNPHLPKAIAPVIAKGLEKDRNNRWQSAGEYAAALSAAAGDTGRTAQERLGNFVRRLFPEIEAKAQRLERFGKQRFSEENLAGDLHLRTQTGFMQTLTPTEDPSAIVIDRDDPVQPVDLDGDPESFRERLTRIVDASVMASRQHGASDLSRDFGPPPALRFGSKTKAYDSNEIAVDTPVHVLRRPSSISGRTGGIANVPKDRASSVKPTDSKTDTLARVQLQAAARDAAEQIESPPPKPLPPARGLSDPRLAAPDSGGGLAKIPRVPTDPRMAGADMSGGLARIPRVPTDPRAPRELSQVVPGPHSVMVSTQRSINWTAMAILALAAAVVVNGAFDYLKDRRPAPSGRASSEERGGQPGVGARAGTAEESREALREADDPERIPALTDPGKDPSRLRRPPRPSPPPSETKPPVAPPAPPPPAAPDSSNARELVELKRLLADLQTAEQAGGRLESVPAYRSFWLRLKLLEESFPKELRPHVARIYSAEMSRGLTMKHLEAAVSAAERASGGKAP